jgi:hypothetical protein
MANGKGPSGDQLKRCFSRNEINTLRSVVQLAIRLAQADQNNAPAQAGRTGICPKSSNRAREKRQNKCVRLWDLRASRALGCSVLNHPDRPSGWCRLID